MGGVHTLGSSTHWVINAVVSFLFPVVAAYFRAGPFVVFLVVVIAQFLAVPLFFPETSGVTLEAIGRRIDQQRSVSNAG